MKTLEKYLYEPMNALTHFVGLVGSIFGLWLLLRATWGETGKSISLAVYGLSMIVLFSASTLLHGLRTTPKIHYRLNRLDHAAIFLVIAGTYTPILYNLFSDPWRWRILTAVWLIAIVGIAFKLFSLKIHSFFNASIYLIISWGGALPLALTTNLIHRIPHSGLLLLLIGGCIYSLGFIIYYLEKPDPWPGWLGHHELWHVFVLGGSFCHFLFMYNVVVPFPVG